MEQRQTALLQLDAQLAAARGRPETFWAAGAASSPRTRRRAPRRSAPWPPRPPWPTTRPSAGSTSQLQVPEPPGLDDHRAVAAAPTNPDLVQLKALSSATQEKLVRRSAASSGRLDARVGALNGLRGTHRPEHPDPPGHGRRGDAARAPGGRPRQPGRRPAARTSRRPAWRRRSRPATSTSWSWRRSPLTPAQRRRAQARARRLPRPDPRPDPGLPARGAQHLDPPAGGSRGRAARARARGHPADHRRLAATAGPSPRAARRGQGRGAMSARPCPATRPSPSASRPSGTCAPASSGPTAARRSRPWWSPARRPAKARRSPRPTWRSPWPTTGSRCCWSTATSGGRGSMACSTCRARRASWSCSRPPANPGAPPPGRPSARRPWRGCRCSPAAPCRSNAANLLSSTRMRVLLQELQEQFDIIVLDTPPVLATADAGIVASLTDGVLLVVRAGRHRPQRGPARLPAARQCRRAGGRHGAQRSGWRGREGRRLLLSLRLRGGGAVRRPRRPLRIAAQRSRRNRLPPG